MSYNNIINNQCIPNSTVTLQSSSLLTLIVVTMTEYCSLTTRSESTVRLICTLAWEYSIILGICIPWLVVFDDDNGELSTLYTEKQVIPLSSNSCM